MLTIRNEQMSIFREGSVKRFEDEMVAAIAVDFEPKFELLGEFGVRALIRRAITAGEKMNIRNKGAVAILIELMVQFGEHFEHSPDRRWAEKILSHPTLPDYIRVDAARKRMTAQTQGRTLMPWAGKRGAAAGQA
jgi:hypothetical protein